MLEDTYGRAFPYLRLSITDVCNFSCQYCLPDGYNCAQKPDFLNIDEIKRLVTAFAELGVWKIRITGGEPTVRKDFTEVVSTIASVPGIKRIALTTNGYRLFEQVPTWRTAGVNHINISVDSLDPSNFKRITGQDRLPAILAGLDRTLELGFNAVKVNAVLLRNLNHQELPLFFDWVKRTPISLRFIELMQTGDNEPFFHKHHISADIVRQALEQQGWDQSLRLEGSGPAVTYSHADYKGSIGIIAPYSKDFCKGCNRLRVTSTGDLRLCLFGNSGIGLRDLLQSDQQKDALKARIEEQLEFKRVSHFLDQGDTGITPHLASLGG